MTWREITDAVPMASWAIVMGTGIVSVDLYADRQRVLSSAFLGFSVAVWSLLALWLVAQRTRIARELRSPAVCSAVAGTAVLGTRFALQGDYPVAAGLLAVAAMCWALLVPAVLTRWRTPTTGTSFVLCVATQGLAVLAAALAVSYRAGWLLGGAAATFLAGLCCYVFVAARFDVRELVAGQGDHWVAGGALAIAALAAGKLAQASGSPGQSGRPHHLLTLCALGLWCLAMAWLVPLITVELVRPRLRYDVRRWATVFPLGMYAACSLVTGQVTGISQISEFGRAWTWVAFAVSLVVLAGLVRASWSVVRRQRMVTAL